MFGKEFSFRTAHCRGACLATIADLPPGTGLAQQGTASPQVRACSNECAKKSVAKSKPRPKEDNAPKTVADRIVVRDGKNLLGQLVESLNDGILTKRSWLGRRGFGSEKRFSGIPEAGTWEAAREEMTIAAALQ